MGTIDSTLISDELVDFLLYDVLDVTALCALPAFADHARDTFDPWLGTCRKLARELLFPAYRAMDAEPPELVDGHVKVHPRMRAIWGELVATGLVACARPVEVGGQSLPMTVAAFANAYLMAGNLSAFCYAGLTTGAAHLIEAFGDEQLKATFMRPMYEGRYTGTMALTEPHAGSSLADITTRATPTESGHYLIRGSKIFISGGDHDIAENVVHLVLARIEGAPLGSKGISLFAVPRERLEAEKLVPNDVHVTGLIHKIGWRGLPSLALSFGEADDCRGWLVGAPNQGLRCMFQMMNEARIMVGTNAAATASVAYQESLRYALDRRQGRAVTAPDPAGPQVPLVEHADVRRMLLRQKAIVEGSLCLIGTTARYADLAEHDADPQAKQRAKLICDLLTPIAKTFPAEKGYEVNVLAVQIHGGYGYSSEYLPEALLRDQKLNSIHEGTTGIQSLDLLGRKVVAGGGAAFAALRDDVMSDIERALESGVDASIIDPLRAAFDRMAELTMTLGGRGLQGDVDGMLSHANDYLDALATVVIGWMWLKMASAVAARDDDFAKGLRQAALYWARTELPRVSVLAALCDSAERSYLDLDPAWL